LIDVFLSIAAEFWKGDALKSTGTVVGLSSTVEEVGL
jgi:hypothetical protein